MISHTQRFFNPPGLLPPLPYTGNPLRALSRSVEDIHFDLNRNTLPDRQLHDNAKMFYDFKNKNMGTLPYMGRNNPMSRPCYSPYPNMSPLYYKPSSERKDGNADRNLNLKSMWPMEHVGEYCAELLNRDKHYWTEEETGLMLELYEENKDYFNDNKTKKTKLWSVIANIINKRFNTNVNSEQCSQKYRNLKAEFLKIADPTSLDGGAKKFGRHFMQMKRLVDAEDKFLKGSVINGSVEEDATEVDESLGKVVEEMENINNIPSMRGNKFEASNCSSTQILTPNSNEFHVPLPPPSASVNTPSLLANKREEHFSNERNNDVKQAMNGNCTFDNSVVSINNEFKDNMHQKSRENNQSINEVLNDINQDMKDKKQSLSESLTNINHLFRDKSQYVVENMTNLMQSEKCMSPPIETVEEIVLSDTLKREAFLNIIPQETELLKLNNSSINDERNECVEHNYSSVKLTPTSVITYKEQIDCDGNQVKGSPYSNELKDIFSDYFSSRNKDLEVYESKERQNIVCMNKCIDVFRKIMMEKIN